MNQEKYNGREEKIQYWGKKLHRRWNNSQVGDNGDGRDSPNKTKNDLTSNSK